jgi:ATP-dependent DNA helicase RecG
MAVKSSTISMPQVSLVLTKNEGHFLDMKAKEITPSKLSRTLSAFANADGGEVYVGIATINGSFRWDGFAKEEDANAHLQVVESLFPIGDIAQCEFLSCPSETGYVLRVDIPKTGNILNASDSTPYIRRGAQNIPIKTAEQFERLRLDKGISSFEDQTLQADCLDITNSFAIIEFLLDVVPTAEPETWSRKQRLIVNDKPVVAGEVLFADEPQVALPKAAIKVYRYKTTDAEGTRQTLAFDPIAIEGNAYHQIYNAVDKVKQIAEEIPTLGTTGFEKISYPTEAIHEVVTNAVIHRDYSIKDDIHIRIFDNRIEIASPGTLPGHVTVSNILEERAARNPKIVRLLNKFKNPPNKDVGEGLNTAFEAMRNLRLRDPIVEQRENQVLVTLKHEKLGTPEEIITNYLRNNREINNSIAREICFIGSENKIKRIFQKMMQSRLIERIPDRPLNKTGYVKGPNFPAEK